MANERSVTLRSDVDILAARREAREMAEGQGLDEGDTTLLATAVSEVARNIVTYAGSGEIVLRAVGADGRQGVEVVARDEGPGIVDVALAMTDGYSTTRSLGIGLPGARRIMDEFELTTTPGRGTTVRMRKWAR